MQMLPARTPTSHDAQIIDSAVVDSSGRNLNNANQAKYASTLALAITTCRAAFGTSVKQFGATDPACMLTAHLASGNRLTPASDGAILLQGTRMCPSRCDLDDARQAARDSALPKIVETCKSVTV